MRTERERERNREGIYVCGEREKSVSLTGMNVRWSVCLRENLCVHVTVCDCVCESERIGGVSTGSMNLDPKFDLKLLFYPFLFFTPS